MNNNLIVMPCFSLEPNKISMFNQIYIGSNGSITKYGKRRSVSNDNLKRKFHNFKISDNAYRTLKKKINWLYYMAKPKHVKTYAGKDIYNFKINFITLTLPSKQKECTKNVTSKLFNQFLTEVRQRTKLENYVWRLEFQKNKNVHYHIVTDCYLDYFFIQKIWNRILKKAGYLQAYSDKFKNLSLSQYNKVVNSSGKTAFNVIAKRYAKGCGANWEQPNTVDVKSVLNGKNIANYISKYFSKDAKDNSICNPLDNEENSKSLRLWFCSRSLSKLNTISDFVEATVIDWFSVVNKAKKVRRVVCQYAMLVYFDFKDFAQKELIMLHKLFKDYAKKQGYSPAI